MECSVTHGMQCKAMPRARQQNAVHVCWCAGLFRIGLECNVIQRNVMCCVVFVGIRTYKYACMRGKYV